MKLAFKQIEPFVKSPDPKARVILVYGPDNGLIAERAKTMSKTVIDDLNDPFNVITLPNEKIIADASAFHDEANAQSLMGGARLILVKNGADSITPILKDYLENPSMDNLVIIESDNLSPRSSLRKLCEGEKNAAAVPCYVDDERNLAQIIRDMCTHAGYGIDQDALIVFSSAIIGDRTIARNEIEKLLLYKGWAPEYKGFEDSPAQTKMGKITLNDIHASCGDVRDWSMDTLVYAIGDGDVQETHNAIDKMIKDQIAPIVMLRATQNHFWRLLMVKQKIQGGLPLETALKTLSPPLFWKVQDSFKRQLNRWSIPVLENALDSLNAVEANSKQSGYSDISLVKNTLLQLARYNPARHAA